MIRTTLRDVCALWKRTVCNGVICVPDYMSALGNEDSPHRDVARMWRGMCAFLVTQLLAIAGVTWVATLFFGMTPVYIVSGLVGLCVVGAIVGACSPATERGEEA